MDFLDSSLLFLMLSLVGAGVFAGFLAGLLGVGGGIVLVPALYFIFQALGYNSDTLMHLCLGTSLAVIVMTGASSVRAHWRKGAVEMFWVKSIGVGLLLGVFSASLIVVQVSGVFLQSFFAVMIALLALLMWFNPARKWMAQDGEYHSPQRLSCVLAGWVIGMISSLVGIGGATMSVPYMSYYHLPMHKAVGSASALGVVIAVPATLSYAFVGWGAHDLPPLSMGYVNVLAWAVIVPFSFMMAPVGARVAHALPAPLLRRVFAIFMVVVASKMGWSAFYG